MLLVLGHPDDPLIHEVRRHLSGQGIPAHYIDESEIFASIPFAFEQIGASSNGYLSIDGTNLHLNQLSGVLVRLPRLWWPPTDLDLQDQMFVYHESSAAWFALLEALSCPVVNRFDLAWWLNDITYPATLVHDLALKLGVHTSTEPPPTLLPPRILPKLPEPSCSSVYLAGVTLIPRSAKDHAVSHWLVESLPTLIDWQRETGTQLSRLDFACEADDRDALSLQHVEVFPWLEGEPPGLIEQIAAATVEMLT